MRVPLLQEMPDQHYQLALCKAKSMTAPLPPLKVHFKNIEIHARKAPCPLYLLMTLKSVVP